MKDLILESIVIGLFGFLNIQILIICYAMAINLFRYGKRLMFFSKFEKHGVLKKRFCWWFCGIDGVIVIWSLSAWFFAWPGFGLGVVAAIMAVMTLIETDWNFQEDHGRSSFPDGSGELVDLE